MIFAWCLIGRLWGFRLFKRTPRHMSKPALWNVRLMRVRRDMGRKA